MLQLATATAECQELRRGLEDRLIVCTSLTTSERKDPDVTRGLCISRHQRRPSGPGWRDDGLGRWVLRLWYGWRYVHHHVPLDCTTDTHHTGSLLSINRSGNFYGGLSNKLLPQGPRGVAVIYKTRPGYESRNRCSFSRFLNVSRDGVLRWRRPVGRSVCERWRQGRRDVQ